MANSWKNRVKFIVRWVSKCICFRVGLDFLIILTYYHGIQRYFRYMYDYDGNGVLDKNDFEVMIKDESYHFDLMAFS